MPHNWASAEFIRLARNLLILERGSDLHLLEGLPPTWLSPGAETRLEGIYTDFGPASLSVRVSADGRSATVSIRPPAARPARRIVVHLGPWAGAGEPTRRDVEGVTEIVIPLKAG